MWSSFLKAHFRTLTKTILHGCIVFKAQPGGGAPPAVWLCLHSPHYLRNTNNDDAADDDPDDAAQDDDADDADKNIFFVSPTDAEWYSSFIFWQNMLPVSTQDNYSSDGDERWYWWWLFLLIGDNKCSSSIWWLAFAVLDKEWTKSWHWPLIGSRQDVAGPGISWCNCHWKNGDDLSREVDNL